MPRKLILGFALCWAGWAFLAEVNEALGGWDARREWSLPPTSWRPGMPQPERLERCLAEVRRRVPPGRVLVFDSPPGPHGADFYRWRWAVYLLPAHDVIQPSQRDAARLAQYLVTYGTRFENPRLELIARPPGCRLYRVRQP